MGKRKKPQRHKPCGLLAIWNGLAGAGKAMAYPIAWRATESKQRSSRISPT